MGLQYIITNNGASQKICFGTKKWLTDHVNMVRNVYWQGTANKTYEVQLAFHSRWQFS